MEPVARVRTCTWAPTALGAPRLFDAGSAPRARAAPQGAALAERLLEPVRRAEALGIDDLLVAQRWWGTGQEIEGSTHDCLAMTAFYAAHVRRMRLIPAVHPGFFLPGPLAKWAATLDRLLEGRLAINVTSGWHEQEFGMYGAELLPHDERYARSTEFIRVLRGAWGSERFDFEGRFYRVHDLRLEPRPVSKSLEIFQGGQSEAAIEMAAAHSDWMFLNGGPPSKIGALIERVRERAGAKGRRVRFALYAIPLCRETDAGADAELSALVAAVDTSTRELRRARTAGARGMWSSPADPLTHLDTNEGFASRLVGSPATILRRMREFVAVGVDCFHVTLQDERFNAEVLPRLREG